MAVSIQLRRGTSSEWTTANPVLLEGEIGIELNTSLYKIGDGVTAWNSLAYKPLRAIDEAGIIDFELSNIPTAPAAGHLKVFAKGLSGRSLLRQIGSSGLSTPFQPSFFQNFIGMINTGSGTSITTIGLIASGTGTISHPTMNETYGYMANFASASSANATAGTGTAATQFLRGISGGGGFFTSQRLMFPDASYNESGATTGTRIFVGLTSDTMVNVTSSDNPSGHLAGFHRCSVNGGLTDTNWFFATKDGTNINRINTGIAFAPNKVYDFYSFAAPTSGEITWRIDNLTDETSAEGTTSTTLPDATTLMRVGFQLRTINALARNVRMQRIYVESDR
jgi:hypothetical protein